MAETPTFESLVQALVAECAARRHRRLVVIAGDHPWAVEQADRATSILKGEWCWIGEGSESGARQVPVEKAHVLLGSEWSGVVYDARAGFDPDAFGAVAGTVKAGGLLLLLTPPLAEWPDYPDPQYSRLSAYPNSTEQVGGRFLKRLALLLQHSDECLCLEQGKPLPSLPVVAGNAIVPPHGFEECASADQLVAVEALCRVSTGHRRRPLVLVSDRGRGKSSALGLAAARLLQQGVKRIIVTAPRRSAVETLFQLAAAQLPAAEHHRGLLKLPDGGELMFEPPDRLVHEDIACDLLLVDEAAAIPSSLLEVMLRKHSRIAFATTVHGYEGTGRGFELRFCKVLDELTPEWRRMSMVQPIRWAVDDPLERLVFRALLLDAEPAADEQVADIQLSTCRIERLDREALLGDEALLSQLFGLLVLAHYRTSPNDLRNLLDAPNLQVSLVLHHRTVLACVLIIREGGFDESLSRQVYAGQRRLRGNLMVQSLATHGGLQEAPRLRAARVMRIAVHPARRGEGVGRRLIDAIAQQMADAQVDFLGASFGGDSDLLDFWLSCDCRPVHIGMRREASSGAHALMVMHPLSSAGTQLFLQARERLMAQLPVLLSEPLAELEPELVARLVASAGTARPDDAVWEDVRSFAYAQRDYGNCLYALKQCLLFMLSEEAEVLTGQQQALAIAKVLQHRPWSELATRHQLGGRKEVVMRLREVFQALCPNDE